MLIEMKSLSRKISSKVLVGVLLLGTVALSSCEDDLNVEPRDTQDIDDILNDPNSATQLVNGVYSKLLDYNINSFSWIGITSITSDDADKGSSMGDSGTDKHKLDNLTFDASDISFNDVWRGRYDGIYRANSAIFYLEQLQIDAGLKERLTAECKFLRALWYFDLVRCFGDVPLVVQKIDPNDVETINNTVFVRRTKQDVYAKIEEDLLDIIDILPLKSAYSPSELGRASRGAAEALLAKVYLYQEKWPQAYDMAGNVITSGQYGLLDDYAEVWRETGENGRESIFEVQAVATLGIRDYTNVQGPRGTPDLGWGFNTPSQSLANSYLPGDVRKNATILFSGTVLWDGFPASTGWTNPRYNYKAYQSSIAESWLDKGMTGKNLRILKYSDILLIRAEAGFHIGQTGEAKDRLDELRVRTGLGPVTEPITLDIILRERRWEMAMEHDRWFDLVRTGRAAAAMAADGKTFITGTHEVFPIPEQQRIASGGRLSQNFGY